MWQRAACVLAALCLLHSAAAFRTIVQPRPRGAVSACASAAHGPREGALAAAKDPTRTVRASPFSRAAVVPRPGCCARPEDAVDRTQGPVNAIRSPARLRAGAGMTDLRGAPYASAPPVIVRQARRDALRVGGLLVGQQLLVSSCMIHPAVYVCKWLRRSGSRPVAVRRTAATWSPRTDPGTV